MLTILGYARSIFWMLCDDKPGLANTRSQKVADLSRLLTIVDRSRLLRTADHKRLLTTADCSRLATASADHSRLQQL